MRPETERNPLDLNNLPEDYNRDGKQVLDDTSSSAGCRKKKSGAKDGKDECGKVYECRFCSLKFCKSQALGGHMNRHRQERETETLNRARQLVFNNDNILAAAAAVQGSHHLSGQPIPHGAYHQTGDPTTLAFRPVYPTTRIFSGPSSTILPPPPPPPPPAAAQSYMYPSPSSRIAPYPSSPHYPPPPPPPSNDYFVGHVLSPSNPPPPYDTNYTCIGAPVGPGFGHATGSNNRGLDLGAASGGGGGGGGRDTSSLQQTQQEEGLNWGRGYTGTQLRLDPSSINRFQDGF